MTTLSAAFQAGKEIFHCTESPDRPVPVQGNPPQKGKINPYSRKPEKFLLGDKEEGKTKREAHKRDVGPVLVFRKDDSRTFDRKLRLSFYLNSDTGGKKRYGRSLGSRNR